MKPHPRSTFQHIYGSVSFIAFIVSLKTTRTAPDFRALFSYCLQLFVGHIVIIVLLSHWLKGIPSLTRIGTARQWQLLGLVRGCGQWLLYITTRTGFPKEMIPSVSRYVLCVFTSLHQPAMMQHGQGQEVHSRHVSDAAEQRFELEPESSFYAAQSARALCELNLWVKDFPLLRRQQRKEQTSVLTE